MNKIRWLYFGTLKIGKTKYFPKLVLINTIKRGFNKSNVTRYSCVNNNVTSYKLTDIGEGIREVTIKDWYVRVDQYVNQFDDICQVESDKATVTITSRYDGKVVKLYYQVGDVATVGSTLLDIQVQGGGEEVKNSNENVESKSSNFGNSSNLENSTSTVNSSNFGKSSNIGNSSDFGKSPNIENSSNLGNSSNFGNSSSFGKSSNFDDRKDVAPRRDHDNFREKSLATPAVRRIAKENAININKIKGTGKLGRVLKEDILSFISKTEDYNFTASQNNQVEKEFEKITGHKRVMFKKMTESNKIPSLGLSDEIDVSKITLIKNELKSSNELNVTLLSFLIKSASLSITRYPIMNSSIDKTEENIIYHTSHNIAIAIDTPHGLVVPNIKNVQKLSIIQISNEIKKLQKLAITNKLEINDISHATFTISNIGSIAGTVVKPLILPPQVAILGVGKVQKLPKYDDESNELIQKHIMHVSWTADHRIIDGATVARFSNTFKNYLENPGLMLVEM